MTVNKAGIGPLATLGIEDRRRSAEAPMKRYTRSHRSGNAKETDLLTERSFKSIGGVLADAIPAVYIERTDAVGMKVGIRGNLSLNA